MNTLTDSEECPLPLPAVTSHQPARTYPLGRPATLLGVMALVGMALPNQASAQGCIAGRASSPMLGAETSGYLPEGGFEFSLNYRYLKSFRHFVGTTEQVQRYEEGSQVINHVHLMDLGLTYGLDEQDSISINIPFLAAERSQAIRVDGDYIDERNETSARGMGDLRVTYRRWLMETKSHPDTNVQVGLGIKLPTGSPNEVAVFRVDDGMGGTEPVVRTADQSIQPGDGGFGFLIDVNAFTTMGAFTPYASGSYLFNPEGTNGVQTFRSRASEAIMSIADQYSARAGVNYSFESLPNLTVGLGGRIDGVPVHDLLGDSSGFRRPGYAVAVEPSLAYTSGRHTFTMSVPWSVQRNRQQSVTDKIDDRHGDAAFADWMLLLGWTVRF